MPDPQDEQDLALQAFMLSAAREMNLEVPEGARGRIWSRLKDRLWPSDAETEAIAPGGQFTTYRDKATGEQRWIGVWSNTRMDREAERFTDEAHREFEAHVDRTGEYPDLRLWHEPAAVIGKADSLAYDDLGFMVATGTFNELGKALYKGLDTYPEPLGMSHGYRYRSSDLKGGEYRRYRTFEVSVLPLAAAANLKTAFGMEESMALREDKKRMFSAIGGEEFANELETRIEAMAKDADADPTVLTSIKSLLEGEPPEPDKEPEPVPATDLKEVLAPVMDALTGIKAKLDQHDAALAELQKSDDEKVSAVWGKANLSALKGMAASSREDTVVDGRKSLVRSATKDGGTASQYAENGLDNWIVKSLGGNQASEVPAE